MFRNYFRTSLRYLAKNKVYALINVLGLAVGLACFLLLTIFARQEFSYDEFHAKKDQIYQVFMADSLYLDDGYRWATQAPMGAALVDEIPEVTNYTRLYRQAEKVVKVGQQRFWADDIVFADPTLFQMFDFGLWSVSSQTVELAINEILISEKEANKMFGNAEAAVGKTIELVELGKYLIRDVFLDLPENSHLTFDYVLPFDDVSKAVRLPASKNLNNWGIVSAFSLYIETASADTDPRLIEPKIREALKVHTNSYARLINLPDVYFAEENTIGKHGNQDYAQLYLGVAILILVIASVNYMNLATARLNKRSKEVGIRKTIGGRRSQLVRQFLTESMLISLSAMVLAICLAEMALPFLRSMIGKSLSIDYNDWTTLGIIVVSGSLAGLVSGIYPALYLSKFNPIQAISRNVSQGRKRFSFRQVLVGFQFFTCLGLMTVTLIVFKQFKHMQEVDKGIDDSQVISIPLKDQNVRKNFEAFKANLSQSSSVQSVSGTNGHVFKGTGSYFLEPEGLDESVAVSFMAVEKNFLVNMDIEMIAGESFDLIDEQQNTGKILINKAAQERFNWDDPIGKEVFGSKIVGVTNDFIYGSAKDAIEPLMLWPIDNDFGHLYVRTGTTDMKSTLAVIENAYNEFAVSYPFEYSFLDEDFASKYEKEQRLSSVFTVFSILAVFVASLGILGLSMYIAEQRNKEIGIRRVLGANVGSIVWLLNKNTTLLVGVVAVLVMPTVHYFMGGWIESFANRIQLGVGIYLLPLAGLIGMIWLILLNQSVKSALQNPVESLRSE